MMRGRSLRSADAWELAVRTYKEMKCVMPIGLYTLHTIQTRVQSPSYMKQGTGSFFFLFVCLFFGRINHILRRCVL